MGLSDSRAGKRCPEDGGFLIRHRVGHGLDFHMDRCGRCGGVWLDADEWDALKSRGLHDSLHLVFTSAWQAEVKRQQQAETRQRQLERVLGAEDTKKVRAWRTWILSHPRRHTIQAYLSDKS